MLRALSALVALACLSAAARAQCNQWSPDFAPSGASGPIHDLLVFDDGSGAALYVAGELGAAGLAPAVGVARWNGQEWSAVGDGLGLVGNSFSSQAVARLCAVDLGGGPLLCAIGDFASVSGAPAKGVALWDGASWSALGSGPPDVDGFTPSLLAAAAFDAGSGPMLYVGGRVRDVDDRILPYLARWDGASWQHVTNGPSVPDCDPWLEECFAGSINGLEVFDAGGGSMLYASGAFPLAGGQAAAVLARYDGASWTPVPGAGDRKSVV